jgi:hypothetical protein
MLYSMSFQEFKPKKRIDALRQLGFDVKVLNKGHTLDIKYHQGDVFGGAHTEAVKFICDPVYNPVMCNMDRDICSIVNILHHEFWCWKNKQPFFDLEVMIADGIMNYLQDQECNVQDEWLTYTPEQIKNKVHKDTLDVFTEDYWMHSSVGHYVTRCLCNIHNDNISWKRVHKLMFNEVRK